MNSSELLSYFLDDAPTSLSDHARERFISYAIEASREGLAFNEDALRHARTHIPEEDIDFFNTAYDWMRIVQKMLDSGKLAPYRKQP